MKLNVPLVLQGTKSIDCGLACVSMILKYYGENMPISSLRKEIQMVKYGTYSTNLGLSLLRHGFMCELVTAQPGLFTLDDVNKGLTSSQLLRRLRELQKNPKWKRVKKSLRSMETFVKAGGKIRIAIPTPRDIEREIKAKRPLISLLTSNFLKGNKPLFNFHFQVITGIDKKHIFANDPLPDKRGGKNSYTIESYFYGLYASAFGDADNASLLLIKRK